MTPLKKIDALLKIFEDDCSRRTGSREFSVSLAHSIREDIIDFLLNNPYRLCLLHFMLKQ